MSMHAFHWFCFFCLSIFVSCPNKSHGTNFQLWNNFPGLWWRTRLYGCRKQRGFWLGAVLGMSLFFLGGGGKKKNQTKQTKQRKNSGSLQSRAWIWKFVEAKKIKSVCSIDFIEEIVRGLCVPDRFCSADSWCFSYSFFCLIYLIFVDIDVSVVMANIMMSTE